MKRIILFCLLAFSLFVSAHSVFAADAATGSQDEAVIGNIQQSSSQQDYYQEEVTLQLKSGPLKGNTYTVTDYVSKSNQKYYYHTGDHILVSYSKDSSGNVSVFINDYDRRPVLFALMGIFLALIIIVSRKQGITAILGMAFSILIVVRFVIPNIMGGNDPYTFALLAAIPIIPITYYLAHGFNKKTTVAIIASFITIGFTALLAHAFTDLARLSSIVPTEDIGYFQSKTGPIDLRSLYLAGVIIGSLAVLNDITISQASVVASLYKSNSSLNLYDLFTHAMSVGRDHIASLINTLVLVYIGSSLTVFLFIYNPDNPFQFDINNQNIALEIVRTFVVSIGVVAAVPITTYLAAYLTRKNFFVTVKEAN